MYTSLYRTMRPERFSEVIGQEHIVKILRHQIETDTVNHAYLFCGTRGTGKTTIARLLAKAVNCTSEGEKPCGECENCKSVQDGRFIDLIELDAASNNSVQDIREIVESVNYPPGIGKKKVYIIDEVHMLSASAANALLKTLEEPPEYVIFILATTEPDALLNTILSRCMRFDFKRVSENVLANHMANICSKQGIDITEGALRILASNADGSVRDGLSLLEQCLAGGDKVIDRETVLNFLGVASEDFFIQLTELILVRSAAEAIILLQDLLKQGKDVKQVMKAWLTHYRALLVSKFVKNPEDMLNISMENIERIKEQTGRITLEEINEGIRVVSEAINDARYSSQPVILMELAIVKLATGNFKEAVPARQPKMVEFSEDGNGLTSIKGNFDETKPLKNNNDDKVVEATKVQEEKKTEKTQEPTKELSPEEAYYMNMAEEFQDEEDFEMNVPGCDLKEENIEKETAYAENDVEERIDIQKPIKEEAKNTISAEKSELESKDSINNEKTKEEIWNRVIDMASEEKSSLCLLRMDTYLAEIGEKEFKIIVSSDIKRNIVELDRELICSLMEKETGRKRSMVCKIEGLESKDKEFSEGVGDIVKEQAKEKWNLDVKID